MNEYKRNREMLKQYENKKITITGVFRLYNKSIEKFTFEKCEMTNGIKIGHMNFNKKSFNKKHLKFERKETKIFFINLKYIIHSFWNYFFIYLKF